MKDVGVVVSLLNVLAVGEVTVVGVVVLSVMHTHTHHVRYFGQIIVLFLRYMVTLASFSQQL